MSPGTEGRDMPAAAAPPAPAPPAPAAAATAPSPEALGTWDGAARTRGGAIVPPRRASWALGAVRRGAGRSRRWVRAGGVGSAGSNLRVVQGRERPRCGSARR